jgi:thiamine phosphate synthase YjbQ (UPF0047 family)
MKTFTIQTHSREELIDLTPQVKEAIDASGTRNGICLVYIPHTTAGVTINENADPSVKTDILMTFRNIVQATLAGSSVSVIIQNGNPELGTWQGIFFCEFDGPRRRKAYVKVISV